jgi:steroid 5-alpha reductase family enzyme
MAEALTLILQGWLAAAAVMLVLWCVQLRTRNAGIVDVGWAGVTGGLAVLHAALGEGDEGRRWLLAILGAVWGGRLAWYLWRDRIWRQPEEGRYVTLRRKWSPRPDLAFLVFFQAQALAAVVLSAPFALAATADAALPAVTDLVALALVAIGVLGESLADRQLAAFKREPTSRGRTCRRGLWRYSRHPNYFFEWILWCGFGCLGLVAAGGWLGLAAPLVILLSILFVTGIPPTEAQALASRGDDYRAYQRTTSAFVPWPPRRDPLAGEGDL